MNKKDEIQEEIVSLSKTNKNIIVEHATGTGKTLSALKIIEASNSSLMWNIVIYERNHKNNWLKDIKKHNKEHLLDRISFICYASFKNLKYQRCNLVFDEAHHISEANISDLKTMYSDYCILLSAKVTYNLQQDIERATYKQFARHKCNISDAVQEGIIPEPKIYIYDIELANTLKKNVVQIKKNGQQIPSAFTDKEYYLYLDNKIQYFKNEYLIKRDEYLKNLWMRYSLERKNFISSCKIPYIRVLQKILRDKNKRFICYYNSVNELKMLGTKDTMLYSEKRSQKLNENVIDNFNSGVINEINSCKMTQESMNFVNLEVGILQQLDSNPRKGIQTTGRTTRSVEPIMFIFRVKDTQDDVYLANFLEDMNKDFIEYIDNFNNIKL